MRYLKRSTPDAPLIPILTRLTISQHRDLAEAAAQAGVTQAQIVRDALVDRLSRKVKAAA